MRRRYVWPALLFALLATAGPARASHTQQSFFQDDRLLAGDSFVAQVQAVNQLSALGIDTIHTVVNWREIAPSPDSSKPPAGFNGANPASYPPGAWDRYDNLVRLADAKGISVLLSPAGPVPNWASRCRVNVNGACKPSPAMYRQFYTALATRYSGNYVDEDQDQQKLPRVSHWDVWNEPNLGAWLYPQTIKSHHKRIEVGAAYYRQLVYGALDALRATGHAHDQFMVAETAPIGGGSTRTSPSDFILGVFCLDPHGKRFRGKLARTEGCVHAKRIPVAGLTHHPYARGAGVPTTTRQRAGSLTLGTLGRFPPLLREIRHSPIAPRRTLGVYFTEFGVTSRPPDGKFGVPLNRQAQYLNEADYLAYGRSWIKGVSQFQLEDDSGLKTRTFQTGLMFSNGDPKPSFVAYRIPIFVVTKGKRVTVWGQLRPVRLGMPRQLVQVQFKPKHKPWRTVATRRTNARGYIAVRLRAARGGWRLRWQEPNGAVSYSRGSGSVPATTPTTPGLPPPGPGTPPTPAPQGTNPGTPPPTGPPAPAPVTRFTLGVTVSGPSVASPLGDGSVSSSPGGIACTKSGGSCSAQYDAGTQVTLTAQPSRLATFSGWGGDCASAGSANTCTVTLDQARNVTATFGP